MAITTPTPLGTISASQWGQKVVDDLTSLDARTTPLEAPPFCEISCSATQGPIAATTFTQITLGVKVEDTLGTMADLANSQIIVKKAGLYRVAAQITYPTNTTGTRGGFIVKNGATYMASSVVKSGDADATRLQVGRTIRCAVNDTIRLHTYNSISISTEGTVYGGCWLSAQYVGA